MNARCKRRGCNAVLVDRLDKSTGRIAYVCEPCERNASGRCRDCPAPIERPRRLRCATCRRAHWLKVKNRVEKKRRGDPATREHINRLRRESYQKPENHQRERERQRRYRDRVGKPARDDFDRLYHKLWMRNWRRKRREERQRESKVAIARRRIAA